LISIGVVSNAIDFIFNTFCFASFGRLALFYFASYMRGLRVPISSAAPAFLYRFVLCFANVKRGSRVPISSAAPAFLYQARLPRSYIKRGSTTATTTTTTTTTTIYCYYVLPLRNAEAANYI